jgi:hypothetical protein
MRLCDGLLGFLNRRAGRWYGPLVAGAVALSLCGRPSQVTAVEIPFESLLHGNPRRSLILDLEHYPPSFFSASTEYWDVYYEKRAPRYQDYHHSAQTVLGLRRFERWSLGLELGRAALTLEQDNVYTSADRMRGGREEMASQAIIGFETTGAYPAGISALRLYGAAGWREGFAGNFEAELRWSNRAKLRLQAETFGSYLEIDQEMNGFRFPLDFPFRTERYRGVAQVMPRTWRIETWGDVELNSGDGDPDHGFANQLWFQRTELGFALSRGVDEFHRFHTVARRARGSGPLAFRFALAAGRGDGDVAMSFDGTRYLHLDGLETSTTAARLDVVPLRWLAVFGGVDQLFIRNSGSSFFDPWPFYVWDVFVAKRYRLDDLDVRMATWYAGVGAMLQGRRVEFEVSARLERWDHESAVTVLERKDLLFPFFFTYEPFEKGASVPFDYALQLDPAVAWRITERLLLRAQARGLVPLHRKDSPSAEPPSSSTGGSVETSPTGSGLTHGGLFGRLEILWWL